MGAKENEDLIRSGYEAFQKGDLAAFDNILAEDCVWHVPGRGQLAGVKRGRKATVEYYAKLGELSGGTVRADVHDVIANEGHVVGLHTNTAQRGDKSLETTSVIVFHVRNGRVSEAWEHPFDVYQQDDLYA